MTEFGEVNAGRLHASILVGWPFGGGVSVMKNRSLIKDSQHLNRAVELIELGAPPASAGIRDRFAA